METVLKTAIIGYGERGKIYGDYMRAHPDQYHCVAVVDINDHRLALARSDFGQQAELFKDVNEFCSRKRGVDAVFICTQDEDHLAHARLLLPYRYDILVEKPIATTKADCLAFKNVVHKYKNKVIVAHVLRYTPFYVKIKEILESGVLGDIVNLLQIENVAYWHQAHSFVRGPWHNSAQSCPMLLAKCCHDLDIIRWLIDKPVKSVSSFGSLKYFCNRYAPSEAAPQCCVCPVKECVYRAETFYYERPEWQNYFRYSYKEGTPLADMLKSSVYGRCVFKMDNDVVDHQLVNMDFGDGVYAHLTMTAFSKDCHRELRINGTKGELSGDLDKRFITYTCFDGTSETIDINSLHNDFSHHQGGDNLLMQSFYDYIAGGKRSSNITDIDVSIDSHMMAFMAEKSRIKHGKLIKAPKAGRK